jgi:hypothetical protein
MPTDPEAPESSPSVDEPTPLYSLAPLSAPGEVESDEEAPASLWSGVWDRKWLLLGASVVAFCGALVAGHFIAMRHSTTPDPAAVSATTVSPSAVVMPQEARNGVVDPPDLAPAVADTALAPPAAPPSGAEEAPGATEVTNVEEAPGATEATPNAGASHAKSRVRSYVRSRAPAPTQGKRFMPNQI